MLPDREAPSLPSPTTVGDAAPAAGDNAPTTADSHSAPHTTLPLPQCEACGWLFVNGRCKRCEAGIAPPTWQKAAEPSPAEIVPPSGRSGSPQAVVDTLDNPGHNPEPKPEIGTLVPQRHGGALKYGSRTPGPGRPKALIRQTAIAHTEQGVEFLRRVMDGIEQETFVTSFGLSVKVPAKMRERIAAALGLAKIAGVTEPSDDDGEDRPTLTVRVVYE